MDNFLAKNKESLFQILFYQNPQPMWFFDTATLRFLEVNNATLEQYGYSREEFLGMTITDIRPREDIEKLKSVLQSLSGPATHKRDFRHVVKNGTIIHVQIVSYPVDFNEQPARLVMVNDITRLSLYVERFELLTRATHDAIWDWNLETNELWWNETFLHLFGDNETEIEQNIESWSSRVHPEDKERVVNGIRQVIQTGEKNWTDQYRFARADGSYANILDRGYTIFTEDKAVRMVGSMMDITQQIELQKARDETDSLLQTLTTASPTALWMSDASGELVYVNQKWKEWTSAFTSDSLNDTWLNVIHPDDRQRVAEAYDKAHLVQEAYHIDYRICFKDSSVRWVIASGTPRHLPGGEFIGLVGSCTDITRQKHLEIQKDGFISTVSHELRTPITSIKGYEQLLSRSETVNDPRAQRFLSRMRVQIARLDNLVQDLLDISRIESGKLTFNESEFEVNLLLAEVVSDLQLIFPSHRLIIKENHACKFFADRNRYIQLLTNLIDNAVKYSPAADKVYISLTCDCEYLTCSIQDFGQGIPKEQQAYIFERFYQVNDVYRAPGLGIGLYICNEIVKRQNGELWFDSTIGQGSTFSFKLPCKD